MRRYLPRRVLEEPYAALATRRRLRRFRDAHAGESCVIIGNGPSLNKVDFDLLARIPTFGVNGIFYKTEEVGFRPLYYVVEDSAVMADNLEQIRGYRPKAGGAKFLSAKYRLRFVPENGTYFMNLNRGFYEPRSPYFEVPRFSPDSSVQVFCGQSVTIVNLQLAYYMGFRNVYLVGMDFSYAIPDSAVVTGHVIESTEEDPNHFHPDYFGPGKRWHDPKLHNVLKSYRLAKLMFEMDGRRIFNATAGGALELFDRVDLESAI